MSPTALHSPLAHALLVILASAGSAAIAAVVDGLHSGAIPVPPAYAIFGTLAASLLTAAGVALRDWREKNAAAPTPIQPVLPVKPAQPGG